MTSKLDRVTNIVLLFTCVLLSGLIVRKMYSNEHDAQPRAGTPVQDVESQKLLVSIGDSPVQGAPSAKVAVVEFADFECPFCGRYSRDVFPSLRRDFLGKGNVRYIARHLPLPIHPNALSAARAAECARTEGRYWEMREKLFAAQADLSSEGLVRSATDIGLNEQAFRDCLADSQKTPSVSSDQAEAARLGIAATPTFLVGIVQGTQLKVLTKINGAAPLSVFREALERANSTIH